MSAPHIEFSSVLASSVHDMKNSLCMLIQSIENLSVKAEQKGDSKEYGMDLSQLHYEASRINSGLMQILALYRIEKHQFPLTIEEVFVTDLLEELIEKNSLYKKNMGIELTLNSEPDLTWELDRDLISYLVNDVLVNALRYTKDKILLSTAIQEGALEIRISDNGDGYPESVLKQRPMTQYQFNPNLGRSGLGFYFAQLIASAHNKRGLPGQIEIENNKDETGATFTLRLP